MLRFAIVLMLLTSIGLAGCIQMNPPGDYYDEEDDEAEAETERGGGGGGY